MVTLAQTNSTIAAFQHQLDLKDKPLLKEKNKTPKYLIRSKTQNTQIPHKKFNPQTLRPKKITIIKINQVKQPQT